MGDSSTLTTGLRAYASGPMRPPGAHRYARLVDATGRPDLGARSPRSAGRGRQAAGIILTWCGALLFPVALATMPRTIWTHDLVAWLRTSLWALTLVFLVRLLLRRPLVATSLGLAGLVATELAVPSWELGYVEVLAVDVAVLYIVATWPSRVALLAAAMVLGTELALVAVAPDDPNVVPTPTPFVVLAMVTAWAIGSSFAQLRRHNETLRAQAAVQAVTAERLRIARELHDLVSHSIGSIAIQAGVGRRVIETQPAEARNALAAIETTSRETLAGLRRTLGALRRSDPEPGPGAALIDPPPGLHDLDRLVESLLDAGVRVEIRRLGEPRPLPPDVDLAAFRIIQESVTNVVRHARTPSCRVTVTHEDTEVAIVIDDEGCGGLVSGAGYGIVGMRERAELLGGHLDAGARPEGGFRVTARLPLAEAAG
jgi:signal transduction histidine kinase